MKKTLLSICFLPLLVSARIGNSSSSRHEPIIEEVEEQLQDNRKLSLNRAFNIANNIFNKNIFGNNNEDDDAECCCCENSDNTTVPTQSPMPSTMNSFSSSPTIEPKLYACPSMMNKVAVKFRKKNPSFDPPVLNPLEQKSFSSLSCPNPKDPPVEVSPEASIEIENSPLLDTLCTLTFLQYNPNGDDIIIPIGKTYDGHNWELSGGPFIHSIQFDCSSSSSSCTVITPPKPDSSPQSKFQLISFQLSSSSSQLKSQNIAARFFEQVTFGTKRSDIAPYTDLPNMGDSSARHDLDSDLAQWAHDQMYTEGETSFRAHFRRNSNTRLRNVENIGKPNHVCSENTRWHKYAFTNIAEAPLYMYVTIKEVTTINGETAYSFSQGGVVITELHEDDAIVEESWDGQPEGVLPPGTYQLCEAQEIFGKYGYISLRSESLTDGVCRNYKYGNPPIQFLSAENQPLNVFEMAKLDDFIPVPGTLDDSGDYLLPGGINDPDKCNFYSNSGSHYPIYTLLDDGTYMIFDPTLELMENTIEAPLYDGGNSAYISGSYCPSAFRTFLNAEDGCVYTDEVPACSNDNVTPDLEIELSDENLKTLHDLTESYPYVVSGLRVENLGNPCVRKGETSRFKRTGLSESQCPETNLMDDKTNDVLVGLLYEDYEDRNNFIRDVYFWNRDAYCSIPENADLTANPLHVYADDECWLLIHPGKIISLH